jgi:hypothetical protein
MSLFFLQYSPEYFSGHIPMITLIFRSLMHIYGVWQSRVMDVSLLLNPISHRLCKTIPALGEHGQKYPSVQPVKLFFQSTLQEIVGHYWLV